MTQRVKAFAIRFLLAAVTWYALTDGAMTADAWIIGVPAVLIAAAAATSLIPHFEWSWRGGFHFALFFLRESWRGGVDVARRAFAPSMPLAPGLFDHSLEVRSALGQVTVVNSSSLLPGSLTVDIDTDRRRLLIHALDITQPDTFRVVTAVDAQVTRMLPATPPDPAPGARP